VHSYPGSEHIPAHDYKISMLLSVEGLNANRIKLSLQVFAKYVREIYWSPKDRRSELAKVTVWLADDSEIDLNVMAEFLAYWTQAEDSKCRVIAEGLINTLIGKSASETLRKVALNIMEGKIDIPPIAIRCLTAAGQLGDVSAMGNLGRRLLDGDGVTADARAGEEWLRKAAAANDPFAMWDLGRRLLDGDGITADARAGEEWLRKAAAANDSPAMGDLGRRLLDGDGITADARAGEEWLRKAAAANYSPAMGDLGGRLLDGKGITADARAGEEWLRKAAEANYPPAMGDLGQRLLDGQGITPDARAGEEWLRKAAEANYSPAAVSLGFYYYENKQLAEATHYFLQGCNENSAEASIDLAYMIRRKEVITSSNLPLIPELLDDSIKDHDPYALVNYSLCLASGIGYNQDWNQADESIGAINDVNGVLDWWRKVAEEGDAEGHLVVGWLVRHGLVDDPDGYTLEQRMDLACEGGWQIPDWMRSPNQVQS